MSIMMNIPISSCASLELHRILYRTFKTSRNLLSTHYETLKLKRDCTAKDIRSAFLKLSKQFHPDKNVDNPNNHAEFLKINEAYSILSKPSSRNNYDLSLWDPSLKSSFDRTRQNGGFKDETFWEQRDKSKDRFYQHKSYYGIDGIKKLPNSWIVAFCICFAVFGVGLQAIAISKSLTFKREKVDEYSVQNSLLHSAARQQAQANGNEVQIELMRQRLGTTGASVDHQTQTEETRAT